MLADVPGVITARTRASTTSNFVLQLSSVLPLCAGSSWTRTSLRPILPPPHDDLFGLHWKVLRAYMCSAARELLHPIS